MEDNLGVRHKYSALDVRRSVSSSVVGDRWHKPVGTCIHHTDGVNSLSWLSGGSAIAGTPSSADVLIGRRGERYLLTDSGSYAFGVGQVSSTIKKLFSPGNPNEYLMSIELEYKALDSPTYAQYDSAAEQVINWAIKYAWQWPYVIYGHYGIANPVGRKSDPYNFDWGTFMGRLYYHSLDAKIAGL